MNNMYRFDEDCRLIRELHNVYYAYHSMDPLAVVRRLMEAKEQPLGEDSQLETAVKILRTLRMNKATGAE